MLVFALLLELTLLSGLTANTLAFISAVVVSYLGNRNWTFTTLPQQHFSAAKYGIVAVSGFALNGLFAFVIVESMGATLRLCHAANVIGDPLYHLSGNAPLGPGKGHDLNLVSSPMSQSKNIAKKYSANQRWISSQRTSNLITCNFGRFIVPVLANYWAISYCLVLVNTSPLLVWRSVDVFTLFFQFAVYLSYAAFYLVPALLLVNICHKYVTSRRWIIYSLAAVTVAIVKYIYLLTRPYSSCSIFTSMDLCGT